MKLLLVCLAAVVVFASGHLSGAEPAAPAAIATTVDRAVVQGWFDSWKAPVPPRHLIANIHYVGAVGVSSFLITTPEGHVLLDTGFEDTVPLILRSVEQLGFRLSDVKLILNSHAHVDHAGGHALMKTLTGARVLASAADARVLASGGADDFVSLPRELMLYAPVTVDRIVVDREIVTLGGVALTANITPGHTRGATTWTMDVTDAGHVYHVVFFSSTTLNSGVSLVQQPSYPEIVSDYEATFARLKELPCDVFFAPHGGQFAMAEKFGRLDHDDVANPFVDPSGWRTLLANAEKAFRDQLAGEKGAARN